MRLLVAVYAKGIVHTLRNDDGTALTLGELVTHRLGTVLRIEVKAVGEGSATITVKVGDQTVDVKVTVKAKATDTTDTTSTDATIPSGSHDPATLLYGDVDLDKFVGATDVVLLNKYLLSTEEYPLTHEDDNRAYAQADASYDEVINLSDSQAIIQKVLGIFTQDDLGPQK